MKRPLLLLIVLLIVPILLRAQPQPIQHFSGSVTDFEFTSDNRFAVITRQSPGDDNLTDARIFFWDIDEKKVAKTFDKRKYYVTGFDISADGRYIGIAYSHNQFAELWNLNTNELLQQFGPHETSYNFDADILKVGVSDIEISPDNQWILTLGVDFKAYLWNVETGELVQTFAADDSFQSPIAFSSDQEYIFTDHFVWDMKTLDLVYILNPHDDFDSNTERLMTWSTCFNLNQRYLYASQTLIPLPFFPQMGKRDNSVSVWDMNNGELINLFSFPTVIFDPIYQIDAIVNVKDIAISPDGNYLLVEVSRNGVWVLNTADGTVINKVSDVFGPVAFSPDGKYALTGGPEDGASLWLMEDLIGQSGVNGYEEYE